MVAKGSRKAWARPAFAAVVAMAASLGGCLADTATGYRPESLAGGFDDARIDDTSWRVGFSGNSFVAFETAETYFLYRSAEVALANGRDGFAIVRKSERQDERAKPRVEGVIQLLSGPVAAKAAQRFDARQVIDSLRPFVTGPKCNLGNICLDGWRASPAYGLFMRLTIYNLAPHAVVAAAGDETVAIDGPHGPKGWAGFAMLRYPREEEMWRLFIAAGPCTYIYEMPRDMTDAPWRADHPYNAYVPMQLAGDMSLNVVAPHSGPWDVEFVRLVSPNHREPIVPTRTCR
jgi:hypothetical protein